MKKLFFFLPSLIFINFLTAAETVNPPTTPTTETTMRVGEFCWNELATSNVQAAKDFYGKVFGWQFTDQDMNGKTYTMIKKDNKEFGGIWAIPKEQEKEIPPHWLAYILVENLEASIEKAKQNKATIIKGPENAGDMGRFAIMIDPTGAHIALWQPLKK